MIATPNLNDTAASNAFRGTSSSDGVDYGGSSRGVVADLGAGSAYKILRIMPLGDSITYGVIGSDGNTESGGYRKILADKLNADGVLYDFVGSLANGPDGFDRNHEGHRGWTINQLNQADAGFVGNADPDAVLLLAGTNDSSTDSASQMISDLRGLVLSLSAAKSDMTIFVASIPPVLDRKGAARVATTDSYNDQMPGLVGDLAAQGHKVEFVDMRGLTQNDISAPPVDSGLHPNAQGYQAIAQYWHQAFIDDYRLDGTGLGPERDTFSGIENLFGSRFADRLTGDGGANGLVGNAGADTLSGAGGNDTLDGGASDDRLSGGSGSDVFAYGSGDELDTILDFLPGTDTIEVSDFVRASSIVQSGANAVLNFAAGAAITLVGVATGALTARDVVFLDAAEPTPQPQPDPYPGAIKGNDDANNLKGGSGNDTLVGYGGNDTLDGGGGSDSLIGGTGSDTYFVDRSSDAILEGTNEGDHDTIHASVSWTLGANLEDMFLRTGATINGTGNALANQITGNSANNVLSGAGGDDTLDGRGGNDTIVGGAGNDRLQGDSGNNLFIYHEGDGTDTIVGFDAGGFTDALEIHDYASVQSIVAEGANTRIAFAPGESILLLDVRPDELTSNDLRLVDAAAPAPAPPTSAYPGAIVGDEGNDSLVGTSGTDTLVGLGGNDTLDGLGGADSLIGGTGNDRYFVDNAGDVISEEAGEGTDEVHARISYALGDNLETMYLRTSAVINATGNALDNLMYGNSSPNALTGLAGNDTLDGRGGNDTIRGGAGDDVLLGDAGNDTFVYRAGDGRDKILDFEPGGSSERIVVEDHTSYDLVQYTNGVGIMFSPSDSIFLAGLRLEDLATQDVFLESLG